METVLDKIIRENLNAHFMFKFFFSENRYVYVIIRKNAVEPDRPEMIKYEAKNM
jgi:hypothetical protein